MNRAFIKNMKEDLEKIKKNKEEVARQLFLNHFDCYTNLQRYSKDELVLAMTEERFVEIVKHLL